MGPRAGGDLIQRPAQASSTSDTPKTELEQPDRDAPPRPSATRSGVHPDYALVKPSVDARGTRDERLEPQAPAARSAFFDINRDLFKSLDLIPDGIEDLGFIDDAFVFRVAAAAATTGDADAVRADSAGALARLAAEAALIREFLGGDYRRLETYVASLGKRTARGRSVDDVVSNDRVLGELVSDVKAWATSYSAPSFSRDEKNLVKLKSFLTAKLPA